MSGTQQLIAILTIALMIFWNIVFKYWLNYRLEKQRLDYEEQAHELHNERCRLELERRKLWGPPPRKK